jgi:hypothetical protein
LLEEFSKWTPSALPVKGSDLISMNFPLGLLFKLTLDEVRQVWKYFDFTLTKEELLEKVPGIFEKVKATPRKKSPKPTRKRRD